MENDLRTTEVLGLNLTGDTDIAQQLPNGLDYDLMSGIPESEIIAFTGYLQTIDAYLGLDLMSVADIDGF